MTDREWPIRRAMKLEETTARFQPDSCWIGLKNTPKVQKVSPRVRVRQKQAPTTNQPFRRPCRAGPFQEGLRDEIDSPACFPSDGPQALQLLLASCGWVPLAESSNIAEAPDPPWARRSSNSTGPPHPFPSTPRAAESGGVFLYLAVETGARDAKLPGARGHVAAAPLQDVQDQFALHVPDASWIRS